MSHEQIKTKIAQLIRAETPWHPLNDQTITDLLNKDGITIDRRTVAKYRDQLEIAPAKYRKQRRNLN